MQILSNAVLLVSKFKQEVDFVCSDSSQYVTDPDADFSRRRILDFKSAFLLPFLFDSDSINCRIPKMISSDAISSDLCESAITQRRSLISSAPYISLFHSFNRKTRRQVLYKGKYALLAVDGSEQGVYGKSVPEGEQDLFLAKTKNSHTRHSVHINALYDVMEKTYLDFVIQPGSQKNEDKAFLELVEKVEASLENAILVADRGYESLISFYRLNEEGVKFVIRIKDKRACNTITRNYPLPEEDTYDIDYKVWLSRRNRKEHEGTPVKFMPKYASIEEFNDNIFLPLQMRIVRFPIKKQDGTIVYETLATNIPASELTAEDLKDIYHRRWEIETSFFDLKYNLAIGKLHSRKHDLILQELYAKAAAYNLASRIRNLLQEIHDQKQKRRTAKKKKYARKINMTYVCTSVSLMVTEKEAVKVKELLASCLRRTIPIRPDRPDTRKKKK